VGDEWQSLNIFHGNKIVVTETLRTFRYHLYPNEEQETAMDSQLRTLCDLYNLLRNEKREKHLPLNKLRMMALEHRGNVHSQAAQNVASRVNSAFKNYFEGRTRFPKPKQAERYRSMTYPQSGFGLEGKIVKRGKRTELVGKLYISKVGHVRIFMHRPLEGKVKTLTVKREADGWYACFSCEADEPQKKPLWQIPPERVAGGDLGLEKFLTLADGSSMENPQFLRRMENKIKRLQKAFSRAKKGSRNRKRLGVRLAKVHLHVARQRSNEQNQVIALLYANADVLGLEKLQVENMLRNHCLAKSIADAAWSQFVGKAEFKSHVLGKYFVPVDPWGTSQFCWRCLSWAPKQLGDRTHVCPVCGEALPRDQNSAKIVKTLVLSYAHGRWVNTPVEQKPLPSLRQVSAVKREAPAFRRGRTSPSKLALEYHTF
jgi:putative transposase